MPWLLNWRVVYILQTLSCEQPRPVLLNLTQYLMRQMQRTSPALSIYERTMPLPHALNE